MVEVEYKGGNNVVIATKKTKLWIDSNVDMLGLKTSLPAEAVQLATEARFLVADHEGLSFEGPGDYETGSVAIHGVAAVRHLDDPAAGKKLATIYRVEADDIRFAVLGNILSPLSDEQLEELGVVDVLVTPVGGNGYTLDATSAASIARQIEPKVVIPVHYSDAGVSYEVNQDDVATFTQELGSPVEEIDSLKIKAANALPPALTVYLLRRK